MKHTISAILILAFLCGCTTEESPQIPETESEVLNNLLKDAPASIVQMNEISTDTLFAEKDHVLADDRVDSLSPSDRLGRISGLVKVGDSLYVADGQQNCIWVLDRQGTIYRKIGRSGRGPGEFGALAGLMRNEDQILTADVSNARIQVFDLNLNLQTTFNHVIYGNSLSGNKSINVTDSLLYLSAGSMNSTKNLISVHQATAPFDSLASFHPRLIPDGMQPGAYNNYSINTNRQGDVAVSYAGLPYVFIYDEDRQLQHVVFLKFPEDDLPDNPPVKPVDKPARTASEAMGVTHLLSQLSLMDDRSLYVSRDSRLFHLNYDSEENKYRPEWAKFFTYADPQAREERPEGITVSNFVIDRHENRLYFGSIFEEFVYQFALE